MSQTVEAVLKQSQKEFISDVQPIVPNANDFIPKVADEDLLDLLDMVLFLFPDDKIDYHLDQLLELKQCRITSDQKTELVPIIKRYVH
jgi:hypothetical protein